MVQTKKPVKSIDEHGAIIYTLDGQLHREDGPALIEPDGTRVWFQNGKQHREDGPALIMPDGYSLWCYHGEFHREDGPAVIDEDGPYGFFINGQGVEPFTGYYYDRYWH